MGTPEVLAELGRLLQLEIDAALAYGAALADAEPGAIRDELAVFRADHQRRALALHGAFARLRACPPEIRPGVNGPLDARAPAPGRPGPAAALAALRGGELLAGAVYARAMARPLPPEVREALEQAVAEGRRRLAWLERALARPGLAARA